MNTRPADAVAEAANGGAGGRAASKLAPTIPALDGFRGLAILWVALGHCWWQAGNPSLDGGVGRNIFTNAYFGVDILFIVSGFVLFLPAAINRGSMGNLRSYALRRFARIVPAFYVCLVLLVVFNHWITSDHVPLPGTSASGNWGLLVHMVFGHNEAYGVSPRVGFGADGVLWTLSVEVLFYAALPLVAGWYFRRPFLGLGIAFAAAQLWQFGGTHASAWLPWIGVHDVAHGTLKHLQERIVLEFPTYLAHFALGMTAAWVYVRARERGLGRFRPWVLPIQLASLAAFLVLCNVHQGAEFARANASDAVHFQHWYDHWTLTSDRAFCIAVFMLATALSVRWAQMPFASQAIRKLGDVSYGVYLFHFPLVGLALTTLHFPRGSNLDFLLMVAFVVPCSLLLGYLSMRFVEQPARRWARSARRRPKHLAEAFQPVPVPMARLEAE